MACWRLLLPLIARPGADQTELITVGSGGYGTDWLLAGWLMQPRTRDPFGDVDDVIDDRSGHTHTRQRRQTDSLAARRIRQPAHSIQDYE